MKKLYLLFLLAVMPLLASAQNVKFGYFSYAEVLASMPDKAIVEKNLAELRAKYDAETKRVENEFNAKYEQFLEGQRDFAPTILQKRQAELQELMKKLSDCSNRRKRTLMHHCVPKFLRLCSASAKSASSLLSSTPTMMPALIPILAWEKTSTYLSKTHSNELFSKRTRPYRRF